MGHTGRVIGIAGVLVTTLWLATALAATARYFWLGDLAVHFRPQYIVLSIAACAALAAMHRPAWALAALCIGAINAVSLLWALTAVAGHAASTASAAAPALRVAAINVFYRSREFERVRDFVRRASPDVVVMVEVTAQWRQAMRELAGEFPHSYATIGSRGRGVLLLSRWPIENAAVLPIDEDAEPAIRATLHARVGIMDVFAVHTRWPSGPGNDRERNRQFARLAALARSAPRPVLVIGDLNVSPLSPHFLALLEGGRLRTTAPRFLGQATWPSFLPLAGIQIDHALISPDIAVARFERGPAVGSDHWPIVLDVVLP